MLRPSYSELMDLLNDDRDLDSQITSRYTIVIAAAKRARQIVAGSQFVPDPDHKTDKAVSQAVGELGRGLVKLYPDGLPGNIIETKRELERQKGTRYVEKTEKPEVAIDMEKDDDDDDEMDFLAESYVFEPDDVDYGFDEEPAVEEVSVPDAE